MHNNLSGILPPKPKTLKSKNNRRNRRRRRSYKQFGHCPTSSLSNQTNQEFSHNFSYNNNLKGFELWRKTYENIMRWQSEHQVNYWRNQAQIFRNINEEIWTKLQSYEGRSTIKDEVNIPIYETSSSEEDEEINDISEVDADYLSFLEITHKHQNERKLSQATEDNSPD